MLLGLVARRRVAEKLLDGEATFQDGDEVKVETPGDPDAAGFVQVMTGQVRDPDRAKEPVAHQPRMQELQSLAIGQPEFLDLKNPWLDSPR